VFPLASANQKRKYQKNVDCSRQHSASQSSARFPSVGEAKRIYLQYRLQVLLLSVEGSTVSERMSEDILETYIRQLVESHRTPKVTLAWRGGEQTL
jgi:hypothetical protein